MYMPAGRDQLQMQVDAGYANTTQFLAPYRGTRYHLQEQGRAKQKPRDYKELFNLRHAQLRNHIERAIGGNTGYLRGACRRLNNMLLTRKNP
jgi:hypothetical protein